MFNWFEIIILFDINELLVHDLSNHEMCRYIIVIDDVCNQWVYNNYYFYLNYLINLKVISICWSGEINLETVLDNISLTTNDFKFRNVQYKLLHIILPTNVLGFGLKNLISVTSVMMQHTLYYIIYGYAL